MAPQAAARGYPTSIMAPRWVLLDREVDFVCGGAAVIGQWRGRTYEEIKATVMKDMKPDLDIADPPEVSRLSMVRQIDLRGLPCGVISSTDKALVLLYAGIPGTPSCMGYLVYDASSNSTTTIPKLDSDNCLCGAAILSGEEGTYLIAELVADFYDAALFLWSSTSNQRIQSAEGSSNRRIQSAEGSSNRRIQTAGGSSNRRIQTAEGSSNRQIQSAEGSSSRCIGRTSNWIRSAARLPPGLFTPTYSFTIDMAFSYAGFSVCWVDLLKGILVCDLLKSPVPNFTFIPLPVGCSIDVPLEAPREGVPVGRPHPQEFRTMGCVCGVIKFVSLVGFHENHSDDDMVLKTWTLSSDLKKWELGKPLSVTDLWASRSFCEKGLPRLTPTFPILSMDDPEVIYVVLNDISYEKRLNSFGEVRRGKMVHNAQHTLCLNTVQNRVISSRSVVPDNLKPQFPDLIASDLTRYRQGSKDHGVWLKASSVGARGRKWKI